MAAEIAQRPSSEPRLRAPSPEDDSKRSSSCPPVPEFSQIAGFIPPRPRPVALPPRVLAPSELATNVFASVIAKLSGESLKSQLALRQRQNIPTDRAITPGLDAYYPPIDDLKVIASRVSQGSGHLFVRSPIGSGKSSLARIMAHFDTRVRLFSCTSDLLNRSDFNLEYVLQQLELRSLDRVFLIVDECHIFFSRDSLLQQVIKQNQTWFVLFLSSSQAHMAAASVILATPTCVTHRATIDLKFSAQDIKELLLRYIGTYLHGCSNREQVCSEIEELILSIFDRNRLLTSSCVGFITGALTSGTGKEMVHSKERDVYYRMIYRSLNSFISNELWPNFNGTSGGCRSAFINCGFAELPGAVFVCNRLLLLGPFNDVIWEKVVGLCITRGAMTETAQGYSWSNPFVARFFTNMQQSITPRLVDFTAVSLILFAISYIDMKQFCKYDELGGMKMVGMPREVRFVDGLLGAFRTKAGQTIQCTTMEQARYEAGAWFEGKDNEIALRLDFRLVRGDKKFGVEALVRGDDRGVVDNKIRSDILSSIEEHMSRFDKGYGPYHQALIEGECILLVFSHPAVISDALKEGGRAYDNLRHANKINMSVIVLNVRSLFEYDVHQINHGGYVNLGGLSSLCSPHRVEGARLVWNQRPPSVAEVGLDGRYPGWEKSQYFTKQSILDFLFTEKWEEKAWMGLFIEKLRATQIQIEVCQLTPTLEEKATYLLDLKGSSLKDLYGAIRDGVPDQTKLIPKIYRKHSGAWVLYKDPFLSEEHEYGFQ